MLVAFGSLKGAPGVSTTVAGLATNWPEDRGLLVAELDPAGGDLAARTGLHDEPGLVSLAAAGRRKLDAMIVRAHCQAIPVPGRPAHGADRLVLLGPPGADQATAAMAAIRGRLGPVLAWMPGLDVLVDCGRLDSTGPASEFLRAADTVVVVARTHLGDVWRLQARLPTLRRDALLILVGDHPYRADEAAEAAGSQRFADLPFDQRAADALTGIAPLAPRALRRTSLMRRLGDLATFLAAGEAPVAGTGVAEMSPPPFPAPAPVGGNEAGR